MKKIKHVELGIHTPEEFAKEISKIENELLGGSEIKEQISADELNKIKALQSKAVLQATVAEKAYADARIADLEANNFMLTVYNKYKLVSGKDTITNDGSILRVKEE